MAFFLNTKANGMSEQSGSDEKWMKGKKSMGLKFVGNCMRGGEQIRKEGWEKRSG